MKFKLIVDKKEYWNEKYWKLYFEIESKLKELKEIKIQMSSPVEYRGIIIMEKKVKEIMDSYWDEEFLEILNKYSLKINEHNLVGAIKMALSDALKNAKEY